VKKKKAPWRASSHGRFSCTKLGVTRGRTCPQQNECVAHQGSLEVPVPPTSPRARSVYQNTTCRQIWAGLCHSHVRGQSGTLQLCGGLHQPICNTRTAVTHAVPSASALLIPNMSSDGCVRTPIADRALGATPESPTTPNDTAPPPPSLAHVLSRREQPHCTPPRTKQLQKTGSRSGRAITGTP